MADKKLVAQITRGIISGGLVAGSLMYISGKDTMTSLKGGIVALGSSILSDMTIDYVLPHLVEVKQQGTIAAENMILQPAITGLGLLLVYSYVAGDYRMSPTRLFIYGGGSELASHYISNMYYGASSQ